MSSTDLTPWRVARKWEYRTTARVGNPTIAFWLDELDADGWELVTCYQCPGGAVTETETVWVFRRPFESALAAAKAGKP
jgi:hypothetical protein